MLYQTVNFMWMEIIHALKSAATASNLGTGEVEVKIVIMMIMMTTMRTTLKSMMVVVSFIPTWAT